MKRILVTGSTGFIGKSLVSNLLQDKRKVFAIIRKSNKNIKSSSKIKKKNKNFFPIFFNKNHELKTKLSKINPEVIVNLATNYINYHPNHKDIHSVMNSNVIFPTLVLDLCCKSKVSKVINLCSIMQCDKNQIDNPLNFYALTKILFKRIMSYYKKIYAKKIFLNLYIGNTYGPNDPRKKILTTIVKNYRNNKSTTILTKNLEMNILHVEDVISAIKILIYKEKKSNNYFIKSKNKFNLYKIIKKFNLRAKRKVRLSLLNKKIGTDTAIIKLKTIPRWKQKYNVVNHFYEHLKKGY